VHHAASCSGVVCTIGGDVAIDRHRGDAAGLGDLGHGELAGVVHALGFVDQRWGHRGFAATGATAGARAAISPAWVRSLMRAASYSAMRANMPKTKLPWAVVVSTMPSVSDWTPTPRVCRVVTMSTRSRRLWPSRSIFQKIRVSPGRRSPRHVFHWGQSALVPVAVLVFRQSAALRASSCSWGVLVGGGHPCVSDSVAHGHAHYRNPMAALRFCGFEWG